MTASAATDRVGRVGRAMRTPGFWHAVTLVAGFAFILFLQRDQWFFFDEYAFIEPVGAGLFDPHVGHWSTFPHLVYDVLLHTVGLRSYLPYALVVTVFHLAAAHLIWRIAREVGADGWLATLAVTAFIVLGSGSENILWAFQIGYVGALVFGLAAFLLALRREQSRGRYALIIALSLLSLPWSGTAIPLVVATAALLLVRHGWRRALLHAVVTGGVYLAWYATFAVGHLPEGPEVTLTELLVIAIPRFLGVMLVFGLGSLLPVPFLSAALVLAGGVWVVLALRRKNRPRLAAIAPALLLVGAAVLFALMTAWSRAAFSVGGGMSSRYVYLLVLLLLPASVLALGDLAVKARAWRIAIVALFAVLIGSQGYLLVSASNAEAVREQGTRALFSAAVAIADEVEPDGLLLDGTPDPQWAPEMQLRELLGYYDAGLFVPGDYSEGDRELVWSRIVAPAPAPSG